jgi:hypothetical protein
VKDSAMSLFEAKFPFSLQVMPSQLTCQVTCFVQKAIGHGHGVTKAPQRAAVEPKRVGHDYCLAETPPVFQAGWSDCMYFIFLSFCSFQLLIWNFRLGFNTCEGQTSAQKSFREEIAVSPLVEFP